MLRQGLARPAVGFEHEKTSPDRKRYSILETVAKQDKLGFRADVNAKSHGTTVSQGREKRRRVGRTFCSALATNTNT